MTRAAGAMRAQFGAEADLATLALPIERRREIARAFWTARHEVGQHARKVAPLVAERFGVDRRVVVRCAFRLVMTCPTCGAHWRKRGSVSLDYVGLDGGAPEAACCCAALNGGTK